MNTLATGHGRSSVRVDPRHYGISNARTSHSMTNIIHGNSNTNVGNVVNSYNTIINVGANEEASQIQAWLSPLKFHRRHQDLRNRRLDGVGDWALQKNEFESWRTSKDGSENPTLLCYGGQGVGKTYIRYYSTLQKRWTTLTSRKISSLVIDTLCDQAYEQNIITLYLYCDYQVQKDQSAVNMIGSLLSQVTMRAATIPDEIQNSFEKSKQGGGRGLRLPDMLKLFVKTISSIERIYICVDAVDELLPQDRSEFLRALRQIIGDAPNIRLFLTGRPYIRGELDRHLTKEAYTIRIVADQSDIARYVGWKMDHDHDRDPDLMTQHLKNDIMKTILEQASDMFLLVALNIDAILGESSLARRRKMLQRVATTGVDLDSVYAQTLQRIREQRGDRSRLGMEVLMWVSHSVRPLQIGELCHALAVEIAGTDLDPENIRPEDTVLGSCLGLAVVDVETSTVRLIHHTLQEYLSLSGILPDTHNALAHTCLAYLNYEHVKRLPANHVPNLRAMPFLEYCSLYWGSHAKVGLSDRVRSVALDLLSRYENHISAALLLNQIRISYSPVTAPCLFTGLHCASYFGIVEVVAALTEVNGCDVNQRDCTGLTPLMWAAWRGNEGVVRILLTRDHIKPGKPDNYGQTPLCWASENGHEEVVRLLLTRGDVDDDEPDAFGRTPLALASENGHEGVVRLLLTCGNVNTDKHDNYRRTPLWWASANGHEGVVRLLLTLSNVSPDRPDNYGRTPLWRAAGGEHEGVVRLLLARDDVNPDKPDNYGRTPLWSASEGGHEGVVRLLLATDGVDPDMPSNNGQTPLWLASLYGHEGVVRLLLTRDDVNPDKLDNYGRTPLWWASENGHGEVVKLLLTRGDVNPDKPDNDGRTPLYRASFHGHEGIVRLLLAQHNVNPDRPDNDGFTPLNRASFHGHEEVVRLLLTQGDVNPDKPDNHGRTPLWWASDGEHGGVVRLLLARDDVSLDKPDKEGQTPLLIASMSGYKEIVALLQPRAAPISNID